MKKEFRKIYAKDIERKGIPLLDYHIHSDYADAALHVEDIGKAALQKGLEQIAITEHIWKGAEWIDEYVKRIEAFDSNRDFVLIGAETRVLNMDGDVNIDPLSIDKFDFIIGSMHRLPTADVPVSGSFTIEDFIEIEEKASIAMIQQGKINVIGHIGRVFEKNFSNTTFPCDSMGRIIKAAKGAGVAVEINAGSKNVLKVFSQCLKFDCPMSFGTDSHSLDTIGKYNEKELLKLFERVKGRSSYIKK
jgi:putative hydrolase